MVGTVLCSLFKEERNRNGCINYRAVNLLNSYCLPGVGETHRLNIVV